jgi:threonine dehydratase
MIKRTSFESTYAGQPEFLTEDSDSPMVLEHIPEVFIEPEDRIVPTAEDRTRLNDMATCEGGPLEGYGGNRKIMSQLVEYDVVQQSASDRIRREKPYLYDALCARQRIGRIASVTPLIHAGALVDAPHAKVWLKLENTRPTGSFKELGAANVIYSIPADEVTQGVTIVTAGNAGLGTVRAAQERSRDIGLRIPVTVRVPSNISEPKYRKLVQSGATVVKGGEGYDGAYERFTDDVNNGLQTHEVHAFDAEAVRIGQSIITAQILEQLDGDVQAIYSAAGGGGLPARNAAVLKEHNTDAEYVIAQSEHADALVQSLYTDATVRVENPHGLADGTMVSQPSEQAVIECRKFVSRGHSIPEVKTARAMLDMEKLFGMWIEGAPAMAIAAAREDRLRLTGNVVVIISGGNVSDETWQQAQELAKSNV